jgi:hypothetical protein
MERHIRKRELIRLTLDKLTERGTVPASVSASSLPNRADTPSMRYPLHAQTLCLERRRSVRGVIGVG